MRIKAALRVAPTRPQARTVEDGGVEHDEARAQGVTEMGSGPYVVASDER
jgi:hypothetical protein